MIICSSSGAGIIVKCRYCKRVNEQGGGGGGVAHKIDSRTGPHCALL